MKGKEKLKKTGYNYWAGYNDFICPQFLEMHDSHSLQRLKARLLDIEDTVDKARVKN